jgi:hypothetical protein
MTRPGTRLLISVPIYDVIGRMITRSITGSWLARTLGVRVRILFQIPAAGPRGHHTVTS